MDLTEKTLSTEKIYDGVIIHVRRDKVLLPNGHTSTREIVEHPGGVGILALEADGTVLLVRQYRYAFGRTLLEIPAGKREPGEEPFVTARRELREETGIFLPESAFTHVCTTQDARIAAYRDGTVWRMVIVLFRARLERLPELKPSAESLQLQFFTPEELSALNLVITHRDLILRWAEENGGKQL